MFNLYLFSLPVNMFWYLVSLSYVITLLITLQTIVTAFLTLVDFVSNYGVHILHNLFVIGVICFFCLVLCFKYISFTTFGKTLICFWSIMALISLAHIYSTIFLPLTDCITDVKIYSYYSLISSFFGDLKILLNTDIVVAYYVFTISIISVFANYHTFHYMRTEQKKERFIILLNCFAFSMLSLTFTKNIFFIFLFWELLGVTSFFLINHNDTQIVSFRSALKALTYNKVSDVCLVLSLVVYLSCSPDLNCTQESIEVLMFSGDTWWTIFSKFRVHLFLLLLFVAASIKSVQIFSYMWLPDSMKAPVPASALIHSATLVAAGFYLIVLFRPLFFYYWGNIFFAFVGLSTACFGAFIALYQNDLKKILAFSTIANCGFMLALLSMFDVRVFLVYFVIHGIFKSVCFMFSGELILLQAHSQDVRSFYNNFSNKNSTNSSIIISLSFLGGLPATVVYVVKHGLEIQVVGAATWYTLTTFFYLYSMLSIFYVINFLLKAFFFNFNSKEFTDETSERLLPDSGIINLIYSYINGIVACSFYYGIKAHKASNVSSISVWGAVSWQILVGLILAVTTAMIIYHLSLITRKDPDLEDQFLFFLCGMFLTWAYYVLETNYILVNAILSLFN